MSPLRSAMSAAHRAPSPRAAGAPLQSGAAIPVSQHCHHPKDCWLIPTHFSQRADSPRVYCATLTLLYHWPCRMIAESGTPTPATPPDRGGWKQPCLQLWLGMPTSRS